MTDPNKVPPPDSDGGGPDVATEQVPGPDPEPNEADGEPAAGTEPEGD